MSQTSERVLSEMNGKLDTLIALTAATIAVSKDLSTPQKVEALTKAGFTSDAIGKVLDLRPDYVRHIRSDKKNKSSDIKDDKTS